VLASRDSSSVEQLRGQRVAVGGKPTTGSTLATFYCPGAELVELQYDQIIDAVLRGEFAAGVMIHEEILLFREKQLRCVCDLGQAWCAETGLPLPVGLNLVRKQLGLELAQQVAARCRRSLLWGLEHPEEAYNFASRFGRGKAKQHVGMFSNQDTVSLPADVCRALTILFDRVAGLELGPRIDSFEVVSGETVTTWQMGSP
jgi:1,4-dihydroxy-6-naphthoate synthase